MRSRGFVLVFLLFSLVGVGRGKTAENAPRSGREDPVPGPHASLNMAQTIESAIQNNIRVRLAAAQTEEERGQALQTAASLLPQLMGVASQSRVFKENLESQGFVPGEGFDVLLGPFNSFDARFFLVQNVFDLSTFWRSRAGKKKVVIAQWQENLAQEQVASAAALSYLEVIRARRSMETAQIDYNLAQSLLDLAKDQHHAGLVTGVDVARANTRLAEANLRLIHARTAERNGHLRLARITGFSFEEPLVPEDTLQYTTASVVDVQKALMSAEADRPEAKIVQVVVEVGQDDLSAARSGHVPTLNATGDFGASGTTPSNSKEVGTIGAQLRVPIFSGRRTEGEVKVAEARLKQAQFREEDTHRQIEEDVRQAAETLSAEAEEVESANQAETLAEQEMQMARDRYTAGVGDNIQVITAQSVLAQAHEDQINALTRYNAARLNFEMSLGRARTFRLE